MSRSVAARLLSWYDRWQRDLPWRRTRDPWAIWVSEIMLQQTRVEVVRRAFPRFLERYPTPSAFAAAGETELLAAWHGLGYYRRARLLHAAASQVAERWSGRVPAAPGALAALPGIGAYTRGAIGSIAFGRAELAIDGNVERVVARHRALRGDPRRGASARAVRGTVAAWQDRARPGDFNQALMELGALVCTPRAPRCAQCPLARDCEARRCGLQAELPARPARRAAVAIETRVALVLEARGRVLGARVPDGQVNAGQIELPGPGVLVPALGPGELREALRARFGVRFAVGEVVARVRHAITSHRIAVVAHAASCARAARAGLIAARPDDPAIPWTTVARKVFCCAAPFLAARE
jgi:A/G-specific adenine glycosylase